MPVITNIYDLKKIYARRVPRMFYDYTESGSWTEQTFDENVTDFQVVLKDINGGELTTVGLSSADAIANQDKVHTAEIYVTVRSANELYKANKITKILNHNFSLQKNDQYHRETFFLSVYLRNLIKI